MCLDCVKCGMHCPLCVSCVYNNPIQPVPYLEREIQRLNNIIASMKQQKRNHICPPCNREHYNNPYWPPNEPWITNPYWLITNGITDTRV